jgi:hypothetical protein
VLWLRLFFFDFQTSKKLNTVIPEINKYYSPFKEGQCHILQLVKKDDLFYIFSDLSKFPKDRDFSWFEREKPIIKIETNEPFIFPYDSYSLWSRQLAEQKTKSEIEKELNVYVSNTDKYATSHLNAIKATHSMTSNSQRRAQTGNVVRANYERKRAYSNALEIYEHYPDKCYEARFSSTER